MSQEGEFKKRFKMLFPEFHTDAQGHSEWAEPMPEEVNKILDEARKEFPKKHDLSLGVYTGREYIAGEIDAWVLKYFGPIPLENQP